MKNIDLFGTKIKLRLDNEDRVKTTVGGYMSILLIIIAILFTYDTGNDIIFKKKPYQLIEEITSDYYDKVNLDQTHAPITFSIMDDLNKVVNIDNYFEIEVEYIKLYFKDETEQYTEKLNFEYCNFTNYKNFITFENFTKSQMDNYFCATNYTDKILKGSYNEDFVSLFSIGLKKCDIRKKSNCDVNNTDEFIRKNKLNFNFNFLRPVIKIENYNNPIKYYIENIYFYISSLIRKKVYFKIENHQLSTDKGYLFEDIAINNFHEINQSGNDILDDDEYYFLAEFYSSNKYIKYSRKYINIINIFANLGGIISFLSIIFKYINSYFADYRVIETIINSIFYIDNLKKLERINNNTNLEIFKKNLKKKNTDNFEGKNTIIITNSKINNNENDNNLIKRENSVEGTKNKNNRYESKENKNNHFESAENKNNELDEMKIQNSVKSSCSTIFFNKINMNQKISVNSSHLQDRIKEEYYSNDFRTKFDNELNYIDNSNLKKNKLDNNDKSIINEINENYQNNEINENYQINQINNNNLNNIDNINNIESNDNTIKILKSKKKANLYLNFFEMINLIKIDKLRCKNINKKYKNNLLILFQGEKRILYYLNLSNIINSLEKVNFLTDILFKNYQKDVIKILNKPLLINPENLDLPLNKGREIIFDEFQNEELSEKDSKEIIYNFFTNYEIDKNTNNDLIYKILNQQ